MRTLLRSFFLGLGLVVPALVLPAKQAASKAAPPVPTFGASKPLQAGMELAIGYGKLRMTQGSYATIIQEGRVVGAFLRGSGSFTYESQDIAEIPAVRTTVGKNSFPKVTPTGRGLRIEVPLAEACLWHDGLPTPFVEGSPVSTGEAEALTDFTQFQASFRRRGGFTLPTYLREHQLNAAGTAWALLELRGPQGPWTYLHDPSFAQEETLSCGMEKLTHVSGEGKVFLDLVPVFSRPLGYARSGLPRADFTLTHVTLDLQAPSKRHLDVKVVETFQIHRAGMRALHLNLLERTYDVASATGVLDPHPYQIRSVRDANGTALKFLRESNSLLVEFPTPLEIGKPCEVRFELDGDILLQPQGDNYWLLKDHWFPEPRLHERAFTVAASLRSRKPFKPLLPGTQLSSKEEGQDVIVQARIDRPVQGYWALAGNYSMIQDTRNGQTIRVATYGLEGANAKLVLDIGFDAIKFYEGFLGPFPFKDYLIAQVPQLGFGIAPPALQLITSEAFQPFSGTLNQLYSQGVNHRIAHEIAHQYWPHVVHLPDIDQAWLSEAFAEYSSALFIRASRGEGKFEQMAAAWRTNAELSAPMAPIGMANRLVHWSRDAENGFWARNRLVYDKGALILHGIRKELGDIPFLKYLKALQLNFTGRQISVEHVQGVLDAISRKDHTVYFEAYVMGTGLPPK